jgi:hypothetical protein
VHRGVGFPVKARRAALGALAVALIATLGWSAAAPAASTATIAGSFGDSCRDFSAHSSKDISHIEIHYADGRVVKDESTTAPDFALDGGAGDELDFASVKSGTTRQTFTCPRTNSPPTAILEILVPSNCALQVEAEDAWNCPDALAPRTTWLSASSVSLTQTTCTPADRTFRFRGTSSTDPDNDITSWSIDFSYDGTSTIGGTSGDWITDPPADVLSPDSQEGIFVTLTVTDSAGQTDSDRMVAGVSAGCD